MASIIFSLSIVILVELGTASIRSFRCERIGIRPDFLLSRPAVVSGCALVGAG
jgi:hypothetical protein